MAKSKSTKAKRPYRRSLDPNAYSPDLLPRIVRDLLGDELHRTPAIVGQWLTRAAEEWGVAFQRAGQGSGGAPQAEARPVPVRPPPVLQVYNPAIDGERVEEEVQPEPVPKGDGLDAYVALAQGVSEAGSTSDPRFGPVGHYTAEQVAPLVTWAMRHSVNPDRAAEVMRHLLGGKLSRHEEPPSSALRTCEGVMRRLKLWRYDQPMDDQPMDGMTEG